MKKLISSLLVVMILLSMFGASAAFAEEPARVEPDDVMSVFLKETDPDKEDIALQLESGDQRTDLVIRYDGDNVHFVERENGAEVSHIQLNPTGIYLAADGTVTLLRYATVSTVMESAFQELDSMLEQSIQSIPEDQMPTEAEIQNALNQLALLAAQAAAQEKADAATVNAAALAFASKFKPEYILDTKEVWGGKQVTLRSEAFATALAEAMDEMMTNPALADVVDRRAAAKGGKTFAEAQKEWLENREATLAAIRSAESVETMTDSGHYTSHFQIGEEASAIKILVCDTDAWVDEKSGYLEGVVTMGFKNEDPFLVYELSVNQYSYREKLSSGDSLVDLYMELDGKKVTYGKTVTVIEGKEWMRAEVGPSYIYMRGPKGSIGSTVRETWTGKTRYQNVIETADGKEATITFDSYQDGDSLVCDMYTNVSEDYVTFKISRIDKVDIEDLSASEKITELSAEEVSAMMESLLKTAIPNASKSFKAKCDAQGFYTVSETEEFDVLYPQGVFLSAPETPEVFEVIDGYGEAEDLDIAA